MLSKILSLFSVGCYAAADDKKIDPATVNFNAGAALVQEGLIGTTKFKNVIGTMEIPFNDSVCARKKVVIIHSRTTPVGDADYASLPIGSICYQLEISSTAVADVAVWHKTASGANGWERVRTDGAIAVYGSDGTYKASYTTINLAVAALATGDILKIKSGSYTLTAACDISAKNCKIIGEGDVTIVAAAAADYAFKIVLGALTATTEVTFENLTIDHGDDATQVGIQINNTSATKKINVYINDVDFESDGGNSIDVDHADADNAIRVYCKGCTTEGPVNLVCANGGDRFRFSYGNLRGGLVSDAGNVDAEILIAWSTFLLNGITGGHANQRAIFIASASETDADPNVYLEAVAGDVETQTAQVIAFDAP